MILHHLTGPGGMLEEAARALPDAVHALIRGGYLAVTTFFVLSGFVLARTYADTQWNVRNLLRYGAGRVARVYPVYIWPFRNLRRDRLPLALHIDASARA